MTAPRLPIAPDPWSAVPAVGDPVIWKADAPGVFSRNFRFGEWLSGPPTPLFESWLLRILEERLHQVQFDEFGMRAPYPRHVLVNGWYFYSLEFLPITLRGLRRSLPTLFARLVRHPRRASLWIGPFARFGAPVFEREWREDLAPRYEAAVLAAEASVESASPRELVALIDRLGSLAGEYFASITVVAGSAYKTEMELARFHRKHLEARIGGTHLALVAGLTPPSPPPDHAVSTLDWSRPTRGELTADRGGSASAGSDHPRIVRQRERSEATARAALAHSPRLLRSFERQLRDAQRYARAREAQTPAFTRPWPVLRRALLRLGAGVATAGVIERPEDVFFLTRHELRAAIGQSMAGSLADAVLDRRATRDRASRLVPPIIVGRPSVLVRRLVLEGRLLLGAEPSGPGTLLIGVPASPGRVTGRVRIIRDPGEGRIAPGEILVAPMTAPAWTPLFTDAAAVVTDIGSALAHASVIAREFGIPAVVGCGDATSRLTDGQLVTVDGDAGLVEVPSASSL